MAFLKIYCECCGGTWEIYSRDNWNDDKARQCPHCFAKIDKQTWKNYVVPALGFVTDANAELFKDHTGYHTPLFSFDVVADHLYKNRSAGNGCPLIEKTIDIDDLIGKES